MISAIFDKYTCTKIDIVPGYTDSSGNWVPAVETESLFTAHVSDVSAKELEFIDPALVQAGVRKIAVELDIALSLEDQIIVTEKDTTTSRWIVVSKMYASSVLKKYLDESRETFLLARKT